MSAHIKNYKVTMQETITKQIVIETDETDEELLERLGEDSESLNALFNESEKLENTEIRIIDISEE